LRKNVIDENSLPLTSVNGILVWKAMALAKKAAILAVTAFG
jgi:hypothetical protein